MLSEAVSEKKGRTLCQSPDVILVDDISKAFLKKKFRKKDDSISFWRALVEEFEYLSSSKKKPAEWTLSDLIEKQT